MIDLEWETVVPETAEKADGVRRMKVPGGWLYQVQKTLSPPIVPGRTIEWHPSVFVVGNG